MRKSVLLFLLIITNAYAEKSSKCPGEEGYYFTNFKIRNPTAGGFVAHTAFVSDLYDDLYIAPTAAVCGFASIEDRANIRGNSLIRGNSVVSGEAVIQGNIIVEGDSHISGKSRVTGSGILKSIVIKDQSKTLTEKNPFEVTPTFSAADLATKLYELVLVKASNFVPTDYYIYDDRSPIKQRVKFAGPCTMTIVKDRTCYWNSEEDHSCGSAAVKEEVTFSIKDLEPSNLEVFFYNPKLSSLDIRMNKSLAKRKWMMNSRNPSFDGWRNDWGNQYMVRYKSSIVSIETKTVQDAHSIKDVLTSLVKACK
jgi:carbonic anhydrase/acetyltransferase-like protein (isoleucine patch superfamily)